jgi:hypothetical protein
MFQAVGAGLVAGTSALLTLPFNQRAVVRPGLSRANPGVVPWGERVSVPQYLSGGPADGLLDEDNLIADTSGDGADARGRQRGSFIVGHTSRG